MVSTAYDGNLVVSVTNNATKIRTVCYGVFNANAALVTVHYKLAMYDNLGVRHYWVDNEVSTTNAPALVGATYVIMTFSVEGTF